MKFMNENLDNLNKEIRETLDNYYKNQTADDFFRLDGLLRVCRREELTIEQIPALIEMQNVILMG